MTNYLVLTVIADDRPGLVETLAQVVADNSANWLESSMAQLAGKFAGLMRVSVDKENTDRLEAALLALDGLKIVIERVSAGETHGNPVTVDMTLVANDRPGIVREISHLIAELAVNVEDLTTYCEAAPMSGEQLFKANARLRVPPSFDIGKLQKSLESLADDLIVEINRD